MPFGHPVAWQINRLHSRRYGHTPGARSAGHSGLGAGRLPSARPPRPHGSKTAAGCPFHALIHQSQRRTNESRKHPAPRATHHPQPTGKPTAASQDRSHDQRTPNPAPGPKQSPAEPQGAGRRGRRSEVVGGVGRLHGFKQPPWGEPLRSGAHIGLLRAGQETARVAESLRAPDLSPQSSSSPKPLHLPRRDH